MSLTVSKVDKKGYKDKSCSIMNIDKFGTRKMLKSLLLMRKCEAYILLVLGVLIMSGTAFSHSLPYNRKLIIEILVSAGCDKVNCIISKVDFF